MRGAASTNSLLSRGCCVGRTLARLAFGFGVVASSFLTASSALAGNFSLNWGTAPYTWTPLSLGPNTYTVSDQFGFQLDFRFSVTRANGSSAGNFPDDLLTDGGVNTFGTQVSIWQVWNPNLTGGGIGGSTNTLLLEILNGGTPFGVNGLNFQLTDVDAVDSNNSGFASDRCDFVTFTGNAGNPTLSAVTGSPVYIIGPGTGAGSTGAIAANQAQCDFQVSTAVTSGTSNGDDNGTLLASYPDGTHTATILYDESIHNVTGITSVNALPRGIGTWSAAGFSVNNTISLTKSTPTTTYTAAGQVITYTYVVTNNGPLPINTGQNIEIQDDKIGTFTCGTISTPVASGATHSCTANYTIVAGDMAVANVTNNAIAGVGTGTQSFATRLQSNTAQAVVQNGNFGTVKVRKISLGGTTTFAFSGATNLASTPASILTATPGVAAPVAPTPINVTTVGTAVTITETAVAGYALTGFTCSDANSVVTGNPASFGTFVSAKRVGTIPATNVRVGADITCTFTNQRPTVRVQKISLGGATTFAFSGATNLASTPASIVTATPGVAAPVAPTPINVTTVGTAVTMTESAVAGYALTGFTCTDANSALTGNPASFGTFVVATRVGTIPATNVRAGADITCTFTNTRTATVKVQKTTLGGFGGPFSFARTNLAAIANITTTAAATPQPATPTARAITTLATNVTITETVAAGYALTAASCTDANSAVTGNSGTIGTLAGTVLTIPAINVQAGADFTCTFTNTNSAIDAVNDDFSSVPINGLAGGATATVFTNDTLGGAAFANAAVIATITNIGGLTGVVINSDGTISVPPGTTAGTYNVTYQICETATPANCDTAVATIVVSTSPPSGGTSCSGTNLAVNGGIETPVVAASSYTLFGVNAVPGWSTNDTGIEVWGTGFNGVPAHTGNAFMEMNANIGTSILTQTPSAIQRRAQLDVYWAHRGRAGPDTARLTVADNGGGSTTTPNFTTGTAAWSVYSTTHIATATATGVTLAFDSISSSGGASLGNFIDTVEVCQTYVTVDKSFVSKTDVDASSSDTDADTVQYQFAIANPAGNNRSMGSLSVFDDKIGTINITTPASGDANTNGFLDPGETWLVNASYSLTQTDVDAATVVNVAYAQGSTGTATIRSDDDTVTLPLTGSPAFAVTKTASATGFTTGNIQNAPSGTVVTYTYVVTNTGNQTITSIALSDVHNASGPVPTPSGETLSSDVAPSADSTDATVSNGIWSSLAPGDSVTFTGTYTITQSDVDVLQ